MCGIYWVMVIPKFIHICFSISSKGAVMVMIVWNSAYTLKLWVQIPSWRGVLHSTLRDKVCQWLVTDWYVTALKIWGHPITGYMCMYMYSTSQSKKWWQGYENVTKLLCMQWAIRLTEKGHNPIYHIIINLWHKGGWF
jgi:hypothetical protein